MKMQQRQFRIGELAKRLNLEKFVIRFWEKEFGIKTIRSEGKQRFYLEKDVKKFIIIKELLYEKGFTIAGAKQQLSKNIIAAYKTDNLEEDKEGIKQSLLKLRQQLLKFKDIL